MGKFIKITINEYLNDKVSTDSKELYSKLKELPYIRFIDRPCGRFLHCIELKLNDDDDIVKLNKLLSNNNWYIERVRNKEITISQIYVNEAKSKIPSKLYHTTPSKNVDNILTFGLKAKSEDLRHKYPKRIYVSDNKESLISLSNELKRWKGNNEYSIIEIDTNGLIFDLYKDSTSAYKGHYYIQDILNIPPEHLNLIE